MTDDEWCARWRHFYPTDSFACHFFLCPLISSLAHTHTANTQILMRERNDRPEMNWPNCQNPIAVSELPRRFQMLVEFLYLCFALFAVILIHALLACWRVESSCEWIQSQTISTEIYGNFFSCVWRWFFVVFKWNFRPVLFFSMDFVE